MIYIDFNMSNQKLIFFHIHKQNNHQYQDSNFIQKPDIDLFIGILVTFLKNAT